MVYKLRSESNTVSYKTSISLCTMWEEILPQNCILALLHIKMWEKHKNLPVIDNHRLIYGFTNYKSCEFHKECYFTIYSFL